MRRSKTALFIVHLLCIGILALGGCVTSQYLVQGKEFAARGEWDKSVQAFQKAHSENPEDQEAKMLLMRAKRNASLAHYAFGEALLKNNRFDEAITEFQLSIALDPSNTRAESLVMKARALKESDYQLKRADYLVKAGNYAQAREALQTALKLNPQNQRAQEVLARFRDKEERPAKYRLKLDSQVPVSLKFKSTPILNVFEVLTRITGVNFLFDKDVQETKVTIFVADVSFDEFLDVFLRTNKLSAKMVNEKTLIIYPDTAQKAKEYQDLQIRTIYLAHTDVKKAVAMLSKILKNKDITPNEALNAVVIRGPRELVEVAARTIEANDRPPSEVMLNVELLEVNRTKEMNLGVEFSSNSFSLGLGQSVLGYFNPDPESANFPAMGGMSLKALDTVSSQNMLLSLPTATINLLKQDGDTKILANPQIRVKNGEKAKIHIGERVPLRTNRRVDTTGAVTNDFQYQDIGVKLDVEANINVHDDVGLKLTLEVSALGANVGTTQDPQYSIRTRTAQSVLNLRPGETIIMGGLIGDEERQTVRKIPFIGEIPVVGHLLSNYSTNGVKTDILMAITPVVIRGQDVPDQSVTQIWSGKEDDFSVNEPYESIAERKSGLLEKPRPVAEGSPEEMPPTPPAVPSPPPAPATPPPPPPPQPPQAQAPTPSAERGAPQPAPLPPREEATGPPTVALDRGETLPLAGAEEPPSAVTRREALAPSTIPARAAQGTAAAADAGMWPMALPYTVQVNSYPARVDAEKRVSTLVEKKFDGFTLPGFVAQKGKTYHRVFVGKFEDYNSAVEYCEELKLKGDFRKDIHVVTRSWAMGG